MLSWESVVEVHALRKQGWSIAAIARHVGATRLTVRRYLSGERVAGQRTRCAPDPFEEFASYCRLRLAADPHLWATTLYEEVVALGYAGSYPSFTRGVRTRSLRPACAPCAAGQGPGGHRAPGWCRNSMGLGRAAQPAAVVGLGCHGVRVGRCVVAFEPVAGLAG